MTATDNQLTILIPPGTPAERLPEVTRELTTIANAILVSMSVQDLTPEFYARRDGLITSAAACLQTVTPAEEETGNRAMKALRAFESENEKQGLALRGPLTAAGKRIKEIEDSGLAPAVKARLRLKSMLDARAEEKIQEQRRAEAAAAAAAKKIEDDRLATIAAVEKLAREQAAAEEAAAQAQREAQLAAAALAAANSPEAKAEALRQQQEAKAAQRQATADAAKLKEQQEAAKLDASFADMAPQVPPVAPVSFTKGYSAKMQRDVEPIGKPDEYHMARNLERFAAFAAANPSLNLLRLLKIELRRADFLEALKDENFLRDGAPGLRIWEHIQSR